MRVGAYAPTPWLMNICILAHLYAHMHIYANMYACIPSECTSVGAISWCIHTCILTYGSITVLAGSSEGHVSYELQHVDHSLHLTLTYAYACLIMISMQITVQSAMHKAYVCAAHSALLDWHPQSWSISFMIDLRLYSVYRSSVTLPVALLCAFNDSATT